MIDTNRLYEIDQEFSVSKKKLLEKHEAEISKKSAEYLEQKKALNKKLAKMSDLNPDIKETTVDKKKIESELIKKANKNKENLSKLIEKLI